MGIEALVRTGSLCTYGLSPKRKRYQTLLGSLPCVSLTESHVCSFAVVPLTHLAPACWGSLMYRLNIKVKTFDVTSFKNEHNSLLLHSLSKELRK